PRNRRCQKPSPALCTIDPGAQAWVLRGPRPEPERPDGQGRQDLVQHTSRRGWLNPALARRRQPWLWPHGPGRWLPEHWLSAPRQLKPTDNKMQGPKDASWLSP